MRFNDIVKGIKEVKIQGARNIAIAGLKAYSMNPSKATIRKLLSLRKTEPALANALKFAEKNSVKESLEHFKFSKEEIKRIGWRVVKKKVFTHCHSSHVVNVLIEAKKRKKKFEVFNTETRPLYQGRKTARELAKAGIKVTIFTDDAANNAISKSDVVLFGCDAITFKKGRIDGIINKIGSGMYAELAHTDKTPVYIVTGSWKSSPRKVEIEQRNYKEVWKKTPKHVKIRNPAFGVINPKFVTGIVSEFGILKLNEFVKKIKKVYPWILK